MLSPLLLLALVRAFALPSPGDHSRTLRVGGVDRHFVLHIPRPARRGRLPLVVVLHGAGGNGRRMAAGTGFSAEADRRGFVAVYPDGIDGGWNDARAADGADDVAFVRAMLDTLAGELRTDPDRVYAAGISNGAMFTHRLACDLPGERYRDTQLVVGQREGRPARRGAAAHSGHVRSNATHGTRIPVAVA